MVSHFPTAELEDEEDELDEDNQQYIENLNKSVSSQTDPQGAAAHGESSGVWLLRKMEMICITGSVMSTQTMPSYIIGSIPGMASLVVPPGAGTFPDGVRPH